jgi:hypothetical protein
MVPQGPVVLVLLALVAAGCISGGAPLPTPAEPTPAPVPPTCGARCDVVTAEQRGSEPHVAIDPADPDRIAVAAIEGGDLVVPGVQGPGWAHLTVRHSSDGGATWARMDLPYATTAAPGSGWSRFCVTADPVLAWPEGGDLLLFGLGWPCTNGGAPPIPGMGALPVGPSTTSVAHVWVARSADGGATWGEPLVIAQSPGAQRWLDKEWGAAHGDRVFVAWVGLRPADDPVLEWAVSDDGGATFPTTGMRVPGSGAAFYGPATALGANGTLHLVYRACGGDCIEAASMVLDADGEWAEAKVADARRVDGPGLGFGLPAAAYDHATGTLVAAWHAAGPGGDADAFVAWSRDGGATWGKPLALPGAAGGHQFQVALAADGGRAALSYYDAASEDAVTPRLVVLDLASGAWVEAAAAEPFDPDPADRGFVFYGDYQGVALRGSRALAAFTAFDADGARTVRASVFDLPPERSP